MHGYVRALVTLLREIAYLPIFLTRFRFLSIGFWFRLLLFTVNFYPVWFLVTLSDPVFFEHKDHIDVRDIVGLVIGIVLLSIPLFIVWSIVKRFIYEIWSVLDIFMMFVKTSIIRLMLTILVSVGIWSEWDWFISLIDFHIDYLPDLAVQLISAGLVVLVTFLFSAQTLAWSLVHGDYYVEGCVIRDPFDEIFGFYEDRKRRRDWYREKLAEYLESNVSIYIESEGDVLKDLNASSEQKQQEKAGREQERTEQENQQQNHHEQEQHEQEGTQQEKWEQTDQEQESTEQERQEQERREYERREHEFWEQVYLEHEIRKHQFMERAHFEYAHLRRDFLEKVDRELEQLTKEFWEKVDSEYEQMEQDLREQVFRERERREQEHREQERREQERKDQERREQEKQEESRRQEQKRQQEEAERQNLMRQIHELYDLSYPCSQVPMFQELNRTRKRLMHRYHPDKAVNEKQREEFTEIFKQVNAGFDTLCKLYNLSK